MSDAESVMSTTAEGESSQREQNILWGNLKWANQGELLVTNSGDARLRKSRIHLQECTCLEGPKGDSQVHPYRKHACWGHSFMILFTVMAIFL